MTSKWARIDASGVAVEFTLLDPTGRYDNTMHWVPVPDALLPDTALWPAVPFNLAADGVTLQVADPVAYAAAQKKAMDTAATAARLAGTTINGVVVATDDTSLALISGAYAAAKDGVITSFNWQGETAWATLTAAQVIAIGQAVSVFVQSCFTKLNTVQAAIDTALASSTDPQAQIAAVRAAAVWPN